MAYGLKDYTLKDLSEVFKKYDKIEKVILYGSRAKGNYKNGSDIDITLKGNLTEKDIFLIENEIDELFMPYKIDISAYNSIDNENLFEKIKRVGKIIYSRSYK